MNRIEEHIRWLGIVFVVWGALSVLIGIGIWLFFAGLGVATGEEDAIAILLVLATIISGFSLITGLAEIIAGWGLLKKTSWSRIVAIIMAILNVINPPLGTAVGVYAFWVLFKDEAKEILRG